MLNLEHETLQKRFSNGDETLPSRYMGRYSNVLDTDTETDTELKTTFPGRKNSVDPATSTVGLRAYQNSAVESLRQAVRDGRRSPLLQAGTGAGKTIMACEVIKASQERGKSSLFLAHRRELVRQCSAKLDQFGVSHGLIMAGEHILGRSTQVASIQTLTSRRKRQGLPDADLVVIDEAHRATARTYRELIDHYREQGAIVLGLTATPIRTDGTGLGDIFDAMVCCPSIQELTDDGFLVPARFWAPTEPDLTGVKVSRGDYVEGELSAAMDQPQLVGDIVQHWLDLAHDRKTVVFASSVAHSVHLAESFREYGVNAEHIDGKTPKDERDEILRRLSAGDVQVITNCEVLCEGWDQPDVSCLVLARPTKSAVRYLQMVGRVLRSCEGKADAMVLDHAGCVHEHGFPAEFTDWALEPGKAKHPNETQRERVEREAKPIVCEECFATYVGKPACPECGYKPAAKGKEISHIDGRLGEVGRPKNKTTGFDVDAYGRTQFFRELCGYALKHKYRSGWAAHKYREKTGNWPNGMSKAPLEPGPQVLSYIRSRQIAYRKAMGK